MSSIFSMPKISINIPCFNSEKFIKETLESVLKQTFKDFEIVIMDDGSDDNTKDIICSFNDSRIRYFYKNNEGLSITRNRAIHASSGEYIAFLDHDDLWLPQKLEKQLNIFQINQNIGLVFSDAYILKNGARQKASYFERCQPKKGFIFEDLLFESSNFIPLSSVVTRKEVFEKIGFFNPAFKLGEELELFLRASQHYAFDYADEPLITYRLHEGNFSRNKEIFVREVFDILNFWQEKNPGVFRKNKKRFLKKQADILAELAHYYALSSRRRDALYNFNLSLDKCPNKNVLIKKYILFFAGCFGYKLLNRSVYGT